LQSNARNARRDGSRCHAALLLLIGIAVRVAVCVGHVGIRVLHFLRFLFFLHFRLLGFALAHVAIAHIAITHVSVARIAVARIAVLSEDVAAETHHERQSDT